MYFKFKNAPFEPKIRLSNDSEDNKYGWRDFLRSFWNSWIRKIIVYLVLPLIILNFWLFRYDDYANNCHIKIHPALLEWNNLQIKKSIKLLKEKSFPDYQRMCTSVESISPELACGGMGGGCYNPDYPQEIVVSTIYRPKESNTEMTAAIIMHEVCHLYQNKEKRPFVESECYQEDCRVEKIMGVRDNYDSRCKNGKYIGG